MSGSRAVAGARAPRLADVYAARDRIKGFAVRTPLVRYADAGAGANIFLKLENLQPAGAFKTRPAANILLDSLEEARGHGVFTASSGNAGIAVTQVASALGIAVTVVCPDDAPEAKLQRLRALGANIERVPFAAWWQVILTHRYGNLLAMFVDAVADTRAMAGSGTIALEILQDLPAVDTILVPFGGGGLVCGIAATIKALKPDVRVIACEAETAQPLTAAFANGGPTEVNYSSSFVSGIGVRSVLPGMWPLLREFVDDVRVVSLAQTADAVHGMLTATKTLAEGAGAVPVAACLQQRPEGKNIVCLVSGGNISSGDLQSILAGRVPDPANKRVCVDNGITE